jgi:hypothetical protein
VWEEAFSIPGGMVVVVHIVGFVGEGPGIQTLVNGWAKVGRGWSDRQSRCVSKEETTV